MSGQSAELALHSCNEGSKALDSRRLHGQVQLFVEDFRERYDLDNIAGRSQATREVLGRIVKVAPTDPTVLITGESGTGKELVAAIKERRFRQELYYRLNVARFELPALRDRPEDIPLLVERFLTKYTRKMGLSARFDVPMERLMSHPFPGNVRELENMIEQAVALCAGGVIQLDDIFPNQADAGSMSARGARQLEGRRLAREVADTECTTITEALRECRGHRQNAAKLLGISPSTLWRRMTVLGIRYSRSRKG